MTKEEWYKQLFERLDNSQFRSSFHLKQKDIDYIDEKGLDTIWYLLSNMQQSRAVESAFENGIKCSWAER